MQQYFHSVTLDSDKCKGCINCIKHCPTEAIRVRQSKAHIIKERCIDCGECIRICPHNAKKAVTDSLSDIEKYKYKVAIPAPTLYGQFETVDDINVVLNALKAIGFDAVFEVARAAEIVTLATKDLILQNRISFPIISTACPAVVRLIRVRFPGLIDNLLPLLSPMEVAAKIMRKTSIEKTGLKPEEIGIFFISPCAAKMTDSKEPLGTSKSEVDGVIAIKDIYIPLTKAINKLDKDNLESLASAGRHGVGWALNGGEASALTDDEYISVNGINNVISVLEELDENKFRNIKFAELGACTGGCVGGPLTVENGFVADTRIKSLMRKLSKYTMESNMPDIRLEDVLWTSKPEYFSIMKLDDDMEKAMQKMQQMDEIFERLPQLDCGSCGSPSCKALAEDIVRGKGNEMDCVFNLRKRVQSLAKEMINLDENMINFKYEE